MSLWSSIPVSYTHLDVYKRQVIDEGAYVDDFEKDAALIFC